MLTTSINHIVIPSRIILPSNNQQRSRKVISRSNYGHVYKFPSIKCGRIMHLEYGNEYKLANIYEFDHSVVYFQEQPFAVEYTDEEGIIRICYPDFLVYLDNGVMMVVEVKQDSDAAKEEVKRKFNHERIAVEQHGYELAVVTKSEIESGQRLLNSLKLKPYRRDSVSAILREKVLDALSKREKTGRSLLGQVRGLTYELLLALQAHGHVYSDLSLPLTVDSTYFAAKRKSQLTHNQLLASERRCV